MKKVSFVFLIILFFMTEQSFAVIDVKSCQSKAGFTDFNLFKKTKMYEFLNKKFGIETSCIYSSLSERKKLVVNFADLAQLRFVNAYDTNSFISWVHINFYKSSFENNEFLAKVISNFNRMGITIDWDNFYYVYEKDEEIHVFCDKLYKSGILALAYYKNGKVVKFKYGLFNKLTCPTTNADLKKVLIEAE